MKPEDKAVVQQALEFASDIERGKYKGNAEEIIAALRQLLEQPEPVAWHDKIMGMEVSMDVSTGDDDIDHRVYGTVYEVIFKDEGGTPDVILAIETERNFTTPPAQPADHSEQDLDMVGLDETAAFCRIAFGKGAADFNAGVDAMLAELKLREKNGGQE